MKKALQAGLAILFLAMAAFAAAGCAGPFEDAVSALERGDHATAMRLFRPLADQGLAEAQNNLGFLYHQGQGVPQDYAEAMRWYRKAADQRLAAAQNSLGVMYEKGRGVPQDNGEALKWYHRAASQGLAQAQYNLGVMYEKGEGVPQDYVQAHKWSNLAASRFPVSEAENRDKAVKNRDIVAAKMTPAQIAEALRLAREWKPK